MRRTTPLLLLLAAVAALQAAPDTLLFVRDGHIWVLPKDADEPRQAIADDPGWAYTQPTWFDADVFAVMRLKDGELNRSHVGMAGVLPEGEYKVADIQWLEPAGGAFNIGVSPKHKLLALTKLGERKEGVNKAFLTVAPFEGDWPKAKNYSTFAEDQSSLLARVHFSPDGKQAIVPTFTDAFGVPMSLVDVASGKLLEPEWLKHEWLVEHLESPRVSCAAWLGDGRILLGTAGTGLWAYDPKTKKAECLDARDKGQASVTDLSVSADGKRVYYGLEVSVENQAPTTEIRMWDGTGEAEVVLENADWPDAAPAGE